MMPFNSVQIFGDYKQIVSTISTYQSFTPDSDRGYLYAFETSTGKVKIGKSSNIFKRLQNHNFQSMSYAEDGIGKVLITKPLSNLSAAENDLKRKLQSRFEYSGSEWIIGNISVIWAALIALDVEYFMSESKPESKIVIPKPEPIIKEVVKIKEVIKEVTKEVFIEKDAPPTTLMSISPKKTMKAFNVLMTEKKLGKSDTKFSNLIEELYFFDGAFRVFKGQEHVLLKILIDNTPHNVTIDKIENGFPNQSRTFAPVDAMIHIRKQNCFQKY